MTDIPDGAVRHRSVAQTHPTSRGSTDLWTGLLVVLVGTIGLVSSLNIREPSALVGHIGPRVFPLVISTGLVILGCLLMAKSFFQPSDSKPDLGDRRILFVMVGGVTVYLLLFMTLGFLITTFSLLTGLFLFLGERRRWVAVVVAAVLSAAVYYGFSYGLNVALPTGPLGS